MRGLGVREGATTIDTSDICAPPSAFRRHTRADHVAFAITNEEGTTRSRGLPLTDVEVVCRAVRGALLRHAENARIPILSGHHEDGAPLDQSHLAVAPLVWPLEPLAALAITGVQLTLPGGSANTIPVLAALARWQRAGMRLVLGRLGAWRLSWIDHGSPGEWQAMAAQLRQRSRVWSTMTPIALDRNPGKLFHADEEKARAAWREAEASIAVSCTDVGLPQPVRVRASTDSAHAGVPRASRFMPYPRDRAKQQRVCVHATIEFGEEVEGPVIVGAGRFFGVGVCAVSDISLSGRTERRW